MCWLLLRKTWNLYLNKCIWFWEKRISLLFPFADLTKQWNTNSSWNIEIWRVLSRHRGDYLIAKLLKKPWGTTVLSSKWLLIWKVLCMPRISLLEKFNGRRLNSYGIRQKLGRNLEDQEDPNKILSVLLRPLRCLQVHKIYAFNQNCLTKTALSQSLYLVRWPNLLSPALSFSRILLTT